MATIGPLTLEKVHPDITDSTRKDGDEELPDASNAAADALKTRICYVSQVVIFLVALIGLTIGLTVGYNEDKTEVQNDVDPCEFAQIRGDNVCDDEANIYTCDFDGGDCCGDDVNYGRCLQCMCLVTTTTSTTYSTTTTVTATNAFDICPMCPKEDTLLMPQVIELAPIQIRSGRYEDCKDVCYMMIYTDCHFFNYFTPEYEGELKNYCILFKNLLHNDRIPMKGVWSGAGEDNQIQFSPGGYGGYYGGPAYGGYGWEY